MVEYSSLLNHLESLQSSLADATSEHGFVQEIYPRTSTRSFHQWAQQHANDQAREIDRLVEGIRRCCAAPSAPIVAVLGLLNAGKSSLVSTFLSLSNRRRILIGASNSQGTHRFVLWLPLAWKNAPDVWSFVSARMQAVFGCEPEPLADDPDAAMLQYNDTALREVKNASGHSVSKAAIEIPLVAFDSDLDRWGLALMDCPDVQTGLMPSDGAFVSSQGWFHEHSQSVADARLSVLANAAPLCSAFIVVLPANALHDQTASRLMQLLQDRMPGVKQILAVNRVPRRYETKTIRDELNDLYGHHRIFRYYMAYGFDGPVDRERIPAAPRNLELEPGQAVPLFFRMDTSQPSQPPAPIPDEDWLISIGSQLDKQNLVREAIEANRVRLIAHVRDAIRTAKEAIARDQTIRADIMQTVANACLDTSTDYREGGAKIRLQASRQIIQQISQSLERTAPWWAMPGRWTTRIAEASRASIASATQKLPLSGWFTGKTAAMGKWIRGRWKSGETGKIVTADGLVDCLQRHDRRGRLQLDFGDGAARECAHRACQRAIDRFQGESQIGLDDRELDEFTKRLWSEMPMSQRLLTGFAPAGVLFAPLVAVLMIPIDFGGSAVLAAASIKELLLAGAAGVGLAMARADSMPHIAESEAGWQQLGDLFAVLCDELGLQRPSREAMPAVGVGNGSEPRTLSLSSIPARAVASEGEMCVPSVIRLNPQAVARVERDLEAVLRS